MPFDTDQRSYQAFRAIVAERTNPLLAWIGSGLSAPAGLPTWAGLRAMLIEALLEKAKGLEEVKERERLEALARAIRLEKRHWVAFSMLEDNLGQTTYRETVREAFARAATAEIPSAYGQLWHLGIRGILNLNIDRLATRALAAHLKQGAQIGEFNGNEVREIGQILMGRVPFVVNLHGSIEEMNTWVFTHGQLRSLTRSEAYRTFIDACLTTHTILFIGLSADDVAVGGHLERLADAGIQGGSHFWLTDRGDQASDEWAERVGIRRIPYQSQDGDHSEVGEFFADLKAYLSPEPPPLPPVAPDGPPSADGELPTQEELERLDAESIRKTLNAHAKELLAGNSAQSYEDYEDFARKYDVAIYRAWYTSVQPGFNQLLGYSLEADVARGSFGRVYRASGRNGERVAVKVLLEEVRTNPELLRTFRRGVRSMRILRDRDVPGMVAYLEASEIPAFVAMEWIEGPNLTEAREGRLIDDWSDLLKVGSELAQIIRSAHALPERVLHRDIRPSNVMLSGFYGEPNEWKVVVLDFDLSWHRGAYEGTVLHAGSGVGFLAPEQIQPVKGTSTRHAAVDAFGIGMTLFYLCSGVEPLSGQHRHREWERQVSEACEGFSRSAWKSIPARMARLILAATQDEQASRWDLAEIGGELTQLREAAEDPGGVTSTELLAEELATHCTMMERYEWDADRLCASRALPTGLKLGISADIKQHLIRMTISWRSTGDEERGNIGKRLTAAATGVSEQLTAGGWRQVARDVDRSSMHFEAEIQADAVRGNLGAVAKRIDEATRKVRFYR